jgi:Prp8 binding protein
MEKNLLKANWDSKGQRIVAGCGDGTVVIWNSVSGKLLYKLPGHKGAVNDASFSPSEDNIVLSASSDRIVMLGEVGR